MSYIIRELISKKIKNNKPVYQFKYIDKKTNSIIKDPEILDRITSIYIPPAYTDVHISKNENKKVMAFGFDDKNRKQIIYHKKFIKKQQKNKHLHMIEFGKQLPTINLHLDKMLNQDKDEKLKMIALIIKLIQYCDFRIGSDDGLKDSGNYGLTTLNCEHIKLSSNGDIQIKFIGKKGVENYCNFNNILINKYLNTLKKQCSKKTEHIFYYNENGELKKIKSNDINDFLKIYGENISSKNFRTWNANVHLLNSMKKNTEDIENSKKYIKKHIAVVADKLHNTESVCKKEYLNPNLLNYISLHFNKFIKEIEKINDIDSYYLHLLENII